MESSEEDDFLPPSPSPAPRIRPKGPRELRPSTETEADVPRQKFIHSRHTSNTSFSSSHYSAVATTAQAALSIRPVTDNSLPVLASGDKSPFPTQPSQFLYPTRLTHESISRNSQLLDEAFPQVPSQGQRIVQVSRSPSINNSLGNQTNVKKIRGILKNTSYNRNGGTSNKSKKVDVLESNSGFDDNAPTSELTTSDTSKVGNKDTLLQNASLPTIYASPSSLPTESLLHNNEPRLVPESTARRDDSGRKSRAGHYNNRLPIYTTFTSSPPPGEVTTPSTKAYYEFSSSNDNDFYDYHYANTSTPSAYSSDIDVDRLAMVEGAYQTNLNNDRLDVPSFLTPREHYLAPNQRYGSSSSPLEPGTVSTSDRSSGGLGAIASVASDLSFNSTPMSTGNESIASSGTVIKKRGYTGPLPAGYYSLFPPISNTPSQATSSRINTPRSQPAARPRRSSSAPPRPVSELPISQESGRNSPVSPISPPAADDGSVHGLSRPRTRSESDSVYNTRIQPPTVLIENPDSARSSRSRFTIGNLIPRKPVARSNAVRWNSYMSTIASESEADGRSSFVPSVQNRGSELNSARPQSTVSSDFPLRSEYRRSSTALPQDGEAEEVPLPTATIDFSQSDPYPVTSSVDSTPQARRRISSAAAKRRQDSDISYASLPTRKPSKAIVSPTSEYSIRADYRDSHSQTDLQRSQASGRGSLPRDGLPAWARYNHASLPLSNGLVTSPSLAPPNQRSPLLGSGPISSPRSPSYGTINADVYLTCPNCKGQCSPEHLLATSFQYSTLTPEQQAVLFQAFRQSFTVAVAAAASSQVQPTSPTKAVKFDKNRQDTNMTKRLYYANEHKHRETLGRAPSPGSRRHTVGSAWRFQDSLRTARDREAYGARGGHSRQISEPTDRSVFRGEDIVSPRLYHSRTAAIRRRSMFLAPSLDEEVEGKGLSRRNIQVWCFALGFIFPIAWWFAAFLPLPPCPRTPPSSPGFEHDLEKTLGPIDQARYENARWWRNINRIMSVVGVGVIVAIIVLAVVASKMTSGQI